MGIIKDLGLSANPFEHYAAETEPNISEYAVRPPYLSSIIDRSSALNSFTLFGERGSGKSATRITVFSSLWGSSGSGDEAATCPLAVNVTDFSMVLDDFQKGVLTDRKLVALVAFHVLEKILAWLSSLDEADREIYIEGLDTDERSLAVALLEEFYLSVPEMDREVSNSDALRLLNSAWTTKSQVWMNARWGALSKIFATALGALSRKKLDKEIDITDAAESILMSLKPDTGKAAMAILNKLVELARAFGFSGVCVLVDKVDETNATANSAEATARLVHPIYNHIQLLEVDGFSWIFFLWGNVQDYFSGKIPVRLDKIAHANITWTEKALRQMVDARLKFFSDDRIEFSGMFENASLADEVFAHLANMAMKSPRELIKIVDITIREHDIASGGGLLSLESIDNGLDIYCNETINSWYTEKHLNQLLRLGKPSLVNKDVQTKFKIGHQGARNKINIWEEEGLVVQDGTLPSEHGGKPVNRYVISDPRVSRIIKRQLSEVVGSEIEEETVVNLREDGE
jgi:hypothetical protein